MAVLTETLGYWSPKYKSSYLFVYTLRTVKGRGCDDYLIRFIFGNLPITHQFVPVFVKESVGF